MLTVNPKYDPQGIKNQWFMLEPSIILETIDDVREALNDTSWMTKPHPFRWMVKCVWIIGLIDEIVAAGKYPYNAEVHRLARERLSLPSLSDAENAKEGTPLSGLIYNAQQFRDSDNLRNKGFAPLSRAMLETAFSQKRRILLADGTVCSVRDVKGVPYAFKPRQRAHAIQIGAPAKLA